jgi:CheY-like chemotaxis protein
LCHALEAQELASNYCDIRKPVPLNLSPISPKRHVVFLVDDEKPFTDLFRTLLEDGLGLKTVAFNDPMAALTALDLATESGESHAEPTLVISDLLMPKMNGFEFLQEFSRRRPGVPSIVVTGSNPDMRFVQANQPPDFIGLIHKPVSWRDIAALLREHELVA